MLDVRCVCCDDGRGECCLLVCMGEMGWSARIGENAMVELLLEQNRASANGNRFIFLFFYIVYMNLCVVFRVRR